MYYSIGGILSGAISSILDNGCAEGITVSVLLLYMTGDGTAPNGFPVGAGISFPQSPQVGDYFLRIDYMPQILYRWDGNLWIRISENVRTETGYTFDDKSLLSGFINNQDEIYLNNTGTTIPEAQPLSSMLQPAPDVLPPEV